MDRKIAGLMGLLEGNKRVYQVKEGEVEATQVQYCRIVAGILFGDKGLAATLGPTWEMIHDPRFTVIEDCFIIEHQAKLGGDAREGIRVQDANGHFTGTAQALEHYSEVLGEGRHFILALQSLAALKAAATLYPGRSFRIPPNHPHPGLFLIGPAPEAVSYHGVEKPYSELTDDQIRQIGLLTEAEKQSVAEEARADGATDPYLVKDWPDLEVWALIKNECPNYFHRDGAPNQVARTLLSLLKADLLGLIKDYAEIANIQETFLLGQSGVLYDSKIHSGDAERVWAEVDLLEQALSYRAELRVTAAQILEQMGVSSQLTELTDHERDALLRIVYSKNWPQERMAILGEVLGFMASLSVSGRTVEERREEQLQQAIRRSQQHVGMLRTGDLAPINRFTDGVVEEETVSGVIEDAVFGNPYAYEVFLRLAGIVRHIEYSFVNTKTRDWFKDFYERQVVSPGGVKSPEELLSYLLAEADTEPEEGAEISPESRQLLEGLFNLIEAARILHPHLQPGAYPKDEEALAGLLAEVERFDPTLEAAPTESYESYGPLDRVQA